MGHHLLMDRPSASSVIDAIGAALLVIGFVGFSVCWQIGWSGEQRVLGTGQFDRPTATKPSPIEVKGRRYFVEPTYARRLNLADSLISEFWLVGAAGMGLRGRKQIRAWWKRRHLRTPVVGFSSNQPQLREVQARDPEEGNIVHFGWFICVGLLFWGILPALVGAAALVIWLARSRLFKRS